jgi:hypothetical protein
MSPNNIPFFEYDKSRNSTHVVGLRDLNTFIDINFYNSCFPSTAFATSFTTGSIALHGPAPVGVKIYEHRFIRLYQFLE